MTSGMSPNSKQQSVKQAMSQHIKEMNNERRELRKKKDIEEK